MVALKTHIAWKRLNATGQRLKAKIRGANGRQGGFEPLRWNLSMVTIQVPDKAKREPALNAALNACRQELQMLNV
jgi:hypothetical protein